MAFLARALDDLSRSLSPQGLHSLALHDLSRRLGFQGLIALPSTTSVAAMAFIHHGLDLTTLVAA
jgi:hypothetical protein